MRSLIKYLGLATVVLASTAVANAQQALQLNIGYNVNIPSGSFGDHINRTAYKGFTAGLAYPANEQLSIGLSVGYNDYYQKYPRDIYHTGAGSDLSAVVSNSVQQIPILLTANYSLVKKGWIRPYIGVGAGVNFVNFDQYLGEFDDPHSVAKWALKGETGFFVPLSSNSSTALKVGASYNYAPFNSYGVKNLDNWGIEAGIRFPIH